MSRLVVGITTLGRKGESFWPKQLLAALVGGPKHCPTTEQVLGAGRPLLAAVQRLPLSRGWSSPSPALEGLGKEGQGGVRA